VTAPPQTSHNTTVAAAAAAFTELLLSRVCGSQLNPEQVRVGGGFYYHNTLDLPSYLPTRPPPTRRPARPPSLPSSLPPSLFSCLPAFLPTLICSHPPARPHARPSAHRTQPCTTLHNLAQQVNCSVLGGLVSITSGCGVVGQGAAMVIGSVSVLQL
jgi:hypothetical protein